MSDTLPMLNTEVSKRRACVNTEAPADDRILEVHGRVALIVYAVRLL